LSWSQTGERKIFGPDLVTEAEEKVKTIQNNLKAAQSQQKSYTDIRRRPLQFQIGDFVYLRVSPTRGIQRFGVKGKCDSSCTCKLGILIVSVKYVFVSVKLVYVYVKLLKI
jgi:hypothetical protein